MDLLSRAYGDASSDDDNEEPGDDRCRKDETEAFRLPAPLLPSLPPPKCRRADFHHHSHPYSRPQEMALRHQHAVPRFLSGAASSGENPAAPVAPYVSKRARAMLAAASAASSPSSSDSLAHPAPACSAVTSPDLADLIPNLERKGHRILIFSQ